MASVVFQSGSTDVVLPERQIADHSLRLESNGGKRNYQEYFQLLQRIFNVWSEKKIATQHLLYGVHHQDHSLNLEIIPVKTITWRICGCICRIWRQFLILLRTTFEKIKIKISPEKRFSKVADYSNWLQQDPPVAPNRVFTKENDVFCRDVTEYQVLQNIKRDLVKVLYPNAPIGLGQEKLHFLIMPKSHRENLKEMSEKEFCETMECADQLIAFYRAKFLKQGRIIRNIYLLMKSGKDAGQTVEHAHMHVIFSFTSTQSFCGKLKVLKNILFGSSKMKVEPLKQRIAEINQGLEGFQ